MVYSHRNLGYQLWEVVANDIGRNIFVTVDNGKDQLEHKISVSQLYGRAREYPIYSLVFPKIRALKIRRISITAPHHVANTLYVKQDPSLARLIV
jgi:hypothetical protein